MKEFTVTGTEPVLGIALSGEIDAGNADEFFEEFVAAYAHAPRDVAFDCATLEFIDSTTLGTFVKILKRVRSDGHTLRIKGLQPRIRKLFVICALDRIMELEA